MSQQVDFFNIVIVSSNKSYKITHTGGGHVVSYDKRLAGTHFVHKCPECGELIIFDLPEMAKSND